MSEFCQYANQTKEALDEIRVFEAKNEITKNDLVGLTRDQIYDRLFQVIPKPQIIKSDLANGNTLLQIDCTQGPTQNHYDYVFTNLIYGYEKDELIKPGDTILETSSGSAGIAFAWACGKLGYKSKVFTHGKLPKARIELTRALADDIYVTEVNSTNNDRYMAECAENMSNHFKNNKDAYQDQNKTLWLANHSRKEETISALQIVADTVLDYLRTNNLSIDLFAAAIGNGSTIVGIPGAMKEQLPDMQVIGYEPRKTAYYWRHNPGLQNDDVVNNTSFLYGNQVLKTSVFANIPGVGTLGHINFPFNERAVKQILSAIVPFDGDYILNNANNPQKVGKTSIISQHITTKILEGFKGKVGACMIYDRANRY